MGPNALQPPLFVVYQAPPGDDTIQVRMGLVYQGDPLP